MSPDTNAAAPVVHVAPADVAEAPLPPAPPPLSAAVPDNRPKPLKPMIRSMAEFLLLPTKGRFSGGVRSTITAQEREMVSSTTVAAVSCAIFRFQLRRAPKK